MWAHIESMSCDSFEMERMWSNQHDAWRWWGINWEEWNVWQMKTVLWKFPQQSYSCGSLEIEVPIILSELTENVGYKESDI